MDVKTEPVQIALAKIVIVQGVIVKKKCPSRTLPKGKGGLGI